MSTVEESYASKLFANGLYTIEPSNEPFENGAYPVGTTYEIKFTEESALKIPLALLYATFQIALSDVANYQAESYMNKIITNQNIQVAANSAIKEAEQMQEDCYTDVADFVTKNVYVYTKDLTSGSFSFPFEDAAFDGIPERLAIESIIADELQAKLGDNFAAVELGEVTKCEKKVGEVVIGDDAKEDSPKRGDSYNTTQTNTFTYTLDFIGLKADGSLCEYTCTVIAGQTWEAKYNAQKKKDEDLTSWFWPETRPGTLGDTTIQSSTLDPVAGTEESIYATPSDDFIQECYTAGITEIDGVKLCQVDENGEVVLKYDYDDKGEKIPGTGKPIPLDVILTDDQLENLLEELNIALEDSSASTQEDMLYAEEYLGQYNSYLAGGSTNIDDLANALQAIAQRI